MKLFPSRNPGANLNKAKICQNLQKKMDNLAKLWEIGEIEGKLRFQFPPWVSLGKMQTNCEWTFLASFVVKKNPLCAYHWKNCKGNLLALGPPTNPCPWGGGHRLENWGPVLNSRNYQPPFACAKLWIFLPFAISWNFWVRVWEHTLTHTRQHTTSGWKFRPKFRTREKRQSRTFVPCNIL